MRLLLALHLQAALLRCREEGPSPCAKSCAKSPPTSAKGKKIRAFITLGQDLRSSINIRMVRKNKLRFRRRFNYKLRFVRCSELSSWNNRKRRTWIRKDGRK